MSNIVKLKIGLASCGIAAGGDAVFELLKKSTDLPIVQLSYTRHYGAPEGIRTPDPRLRRPMLYPAELQVHFRLSILERVMGIGPTQPAWKAGILPLNYTRKH